MPWVDELHDSHELRRCIRDLVALSTLPAIWKDYGPQQIADSVAAAMLSMLSADVVYVGVPGLRNEPMIEIVRVAQPASSGSISALTRTLQGIWLGRTEQTFAIENPLGPGTLRIAVAPIGTDRNAALVAGSADLDFPTETHRLLLGIASNDATTALQRWESDTEQRRMIELIERSSEFVGVSDLAGKPRYLNAAGFELVGLSNLEQASRMSILDFLAPEERSRAEAELMPHVIESGRWFGELNFCHFKTGENIPFLVDWFRIDDVRSGRPMDIATVSRDLRGQKKLEADLRGLNGSLERRVTERTSELAQALDRLTIESLERTRSDARAQELQLALFHASRLSTAGQMAGALAHELNQPLTAFTNSVNAARRLAAKRPLQRVDTLCEVLEEAVAQALRAGEIIRRLREFVTRGETELRIENLSDLIREACHLAFAGMAAHGNKVELLLDKRAETILANKIQLQQVILNLLRNAFEAQSEGPDVKLTTRKLDDGGTDISIADRGPGVPAEMIEHLFEPFYTTKRDGMGLGLSISRTIVEAHGGKLKCEPNPGGGAIFCIMLPLAIER